MVNSSHHCPSLGKSYAVIIICDLRVGIDFFVNGLKPGKSGGVRSASGA